MPSKYWTSLADSIKHLFVNGFTREFSRSFLDPDRQLEIKLDEICSQCPANSFVPKDNTQTAGSEVIDNCRMQYFGQLLQSFVGRAGDDETRKLFSYLKKCEDCLTFKTSGTPELQESGSVSRSEI